MGVNGLVLPDLLDWGDLCWRRREVHSSSAPKGDTPHPEGPAGGEPPPGPPPQPPWGIGMGRSQPPGWGARVGRGSGAPSSPAFPPGWPGCLEAINWFYSSCNEMEMRLPDRGALSWGRMAASFWAWRGSPPSSLAHASAAPGISPGPGAPWPPGKGRLERLCAQH